MDMSLSFYSFVEIYRKLETPQVLDPTINTNHWLQANESNYRLFNNLRNCVRYLESEIINDDNPHHGRRIKALEIGGGVGSASLYWLALCDNSEITVLENSEEDYIVNNMHMLKSLYPTRYRFENISSLDYDYNNDPYRYEYDLVMIDGSSETLAQDIELAVKLDAPCLWIMNVDTEGYENTRPIIDSAISQEDFTYWWVHNLPYDVKKAQHSEGDLLSTYQWRVNSSFLRRKNLCVEFDNFGNPIPEEGL